MSNDQLKESFSSSNGNGLYCQGAFTGTHTTEEKENKEVVVVKSTVKLQSKYMKDPGFIILAIEGFSTIIKLPYNYLNKTRENSRIKINFFHNKLFGNKDVFDIPKTG